MSNRSSVLPSRTTTLIVVAALHALVLWAIWWVRPQISAQVDAFVTQAFFFEDPKPRAAATAPAPSPARRRTTSNPHRLSPSPLTFLPASPDTSTAITDSAPRTAVNWSAQLEGAAEATLNRERQTATQLGALTRNYQLPDDPRNAHAGPANTFRWYDAGSHRIDTRSIIPVLHLNDRCMMIAFIFPVCAIGHIETHGDLFDGAAAVHDEKLATHRPNDPP